MMQLEDHFPLPFIDQMLERLCGNEYYYFLDGFSGFFQIPIALEDQENTTFTCPYGTFAYRRMPFGLCNAPATFQICMTAIFHDMVEDFMEVFMDDFSVFGSSFDCCLANLDRMLARCEETNLVLNWEKCHFMVKEGIVLVHKISGAGIEVDKAKINVIAKLPYLTNVNGVRSFLGHVEFYRSKENAKPRLIRWVLLLQGFNIEIKDKKGAKNLAADLGTFMEEEITDEFPDEQLMILKSELNNDEPWYADYVNYIVRNIVPPNWTPKKRRRFFSQVKNYFWDEPYAFKLCSNNVMRRYVAGSEILEILGHCLSGPTEGHHSASITKRKVYESRFYWPSIFKDAKDYVMRSKPKLYARVVIRFLRRLFTRFRVPKALISDRGTHFYNSQLEITLQKYGVTHKLSIAYHPQTNGQTEVTNRAIIRILERSVGYNPKNWLEKLDDSLWAFRIAYKTPTGCTPSD
ncbi:reverse transcriptase domain-containing protein [Tanacetum coccineum]